MFPAGGTNSNVEGLSAKLSILIPEFAHGEEKGKSSRKE
jgi:hypothetical protein